MELEEKKTPPPGEQIAEVTLDLRLVAGVLTGLVAESLLPRPALVCLNALAEHLTHASEQLAEIRAGLLAKPPRPAAAAPPPPRPHKKPPKAVAAAKPSRVNGAGGAAPAAPEPPVKTLP